LLNRFIARKGVSPMPITEQALLDALRVVEDPDFHKDIVSLGFVKDVKIEGDDVSLRIVLTTPACPVKERFRTQAEEAIRGTFPQVKGVEIIMDAQVTAASRAPQVENLLPMVKNSIAVASGKGGVGKSTVASNLAAALAQTGARVGLLDADIYGPSMGVMLGVTERPRIDEAKQVMFPVEAHGMFVMSLAFLLDPDMPVIWRGPMVMKALEQLMKDVAWPELDYMIVDLPPGTGDAQLTLTQKVPLSGAIIVSTPNEVALIDARKGLAMFQKVDVPILGIVENMSYFVCPHCGGNSDIFSRGGAERTAHEMGVPFLGAVPIDPMVRMAGDGGSPVVLSAPESAAAVAFRELAGKTAQQASIAALKKKE
jgi:ATP-binding protein involved in chromosome partitioning